MEKDSTPASPSSHVPHSATAPLGLDSDYSHNNVIYMQDLSSPNAPTVVEFPPDMNFTEQELALPAPELFRLLRRQLCWATQDGDQLRAEAEALEKQRKEEWTAKELLVENILEAELSTSKRKRLEAGDLEEPLAYSPLEEDIQVSKQLKVEPKDGKLPWWREEAWVQKLAEAKKAAHHLASDAVQSREELAPRQRGEESRSEEPVKQETAGSA
jgi:hypothetical protein